MSSAEDIVIVESTVILLLGAWDRNQKSENSIALNLRSLLEGSLYPKQGMKG